MGDKYILELEDKPLCVFDEDTQTYFPRLRRVKGFNSLVFDQNGLNNLTPYTEPDLDAIKQEEYEKGYKTAKVQCNIQAEKDLREVGERHYQKGLNDAWEAARKFISEVIDASFRNNFMVEIFECDNAMGAMKVYSASECIEKIKQYEQEKEEIQVGDEVISEDDIKATVIDMDDYLLHVLDENGVIQGWPREDAVKTDRHFPEIAEVLRKMREGQEQ